MNGGDVMEFEEQHHDELVEKFIAEHAVEWELFVEKQMADADASQEDAEGNR